MYVPFVQMLSPPGAYLLHAGFSCLAVLEAVPIGDGMQIGEKNFCLARKKLAGILTDFKSF